MSTNTHWWEGESEAMQLEVRVNLYDHCFGGWGVGDGLAKINMERGYGLYSKRMLISVWGECCYLSVISNSLQGSSDSA